MNKQDELKSKAVSNTVCGITNNSSNSDHVTLAKAYLEGLGLETIIAGPNIFFWQEESHEPFQGYIGKTFSLYWLMNPVKHKEIKNVAYIDMYEQGYCKGRYMYSPTGITSWFELKSLSEAKDFVSAKIKKIYS